MIFISLTSKKEERRKISSDHILKGTPPPPQRRYGHIMVSHDRHLYVFGGAADNTLPNELHCYEIDDGTWSVIKPSSDSQFPSGRLFHAASVIGDAMLIFGGTVDNNIRSAEKYRFQFSSYPQCTMKDDFGKLLLGRQFTDVEFIVGENDVIVPAHAAIIAARCQHLRLKIEQAKESQLAGDQSNVQPDQEGDSSTTTTTTSTTTSATTTTTGATSCKKRQPPVPQVLIPDARPEAFEVLLWFLYKVDRKFKGFDDRNTDFLLLLMDVYRLSVQFSLRKLEYMCVHFLWVSIGHCNVLQVLQYSDRLQLDFIKEFCLNFVVKESNYNYKRFMLILYFKFRYLSIF